MIGAGALRNRITIQERTGTRDESGQPLDQWQDVASVWAQMTAATGKEIYAASGFTEQTSHTARIRFSKAFAITNAMRVLHDGLAYDVQGCSDVDGKREFLTLTLLQTNQGSADA